MKESRGATARARVLGSVADQIAAIHLSHPVRVAVDGVDCAGKSIFADELATVLLAGGRTVIRASIDGFHHPRRVRYSRGDDPGGYYRDSFNYVALLEHIVLPLGPNGNRRYRTAVFDYRKDCAVCRPIQAADPRAILLLDGVFLHRHELQASWDFSVYLHVPFETVLARAAQRDAKAFGSAENAQLRYLEKYIPGQILYLTECRPHLQASVVVDNRDIPSPAIAMGPKLERLLAEALALRASPT